MRSRRLLIINRTQFGYHTDTYYYCKYLKNDFQITYLCWNQNFPIVDESGINVIYIKRARNVFSNYFIFLSNVIKRLKEFSTKVDVVFLKYFQFCFVIKVIKKQKNIILDIRTGPVKKFLLHRIIRFLLLKFELIFFDKISIISESLAKKLNIINKNPYIIPLGANSLTNKIANFDKIKLIYVGTFKNRNIHETVQGLAKYLNTLDCNKTVVSYYLIGTGPEKDIKKIKLSIEHNNLKEIVKLTGYVSHDKLGYYLENSNVGVSYIPMTSYFDYQPPTKTFEYLLSGMPVLATKTFENQKVINENNGVLIFDNADSFYNGLVEISKKIFNSNEIKVRSQNFSWDFIIKEKLFPILDGFSD